MITKPLYRHGDKAHPTIIWYWNAGSVEPKAEPMVSLMDATGPDSKLKPRGAENLVHQPVHNVGISCFVSVYG